MGVLQTTEQVTKWKLQSTNQMKNYGRDKKKLLLSNKDEHSADGSQNENHLRKADD